MSTLQLREWQRATPQSEPQLAGAYLPRNVALSALLTRLDQRGMVTVRELRDGLSISTTSYVGSIKIDSLSVRIQPKLEGRAFSVLVGYAIGLPDVELLPDHDIDLMTPAFQDLLVDRLASEASRLLARGLHRHYTPLSASLASPRGRILFDQLARRSGGSATLPCRYYERDHNVLPNRVLLAGLQLAARVGLDPRVRTRALRPAAALADSVDPIPLNQATFRALRRGMSRMTRAYEPAFNLTRLLLAGQGISPEQGTESLELPGFLFDMNVLFQDALGRFLREWIVGARVHEQHGLSDIFRYQPMFNPRRKQTPTPRPDFVMSRGGRVIAIADAKYRDLWDRNLPRDMLYQLSIYALSHVEHSTASILYPAASRAASEARIWINDPVTGRMRGQVCLRPVNVPEFVELVRSQPTAANDRRRQEYAEYLAYGSPRLTSRPPA